MKDKINTMTSKTNLELKYHCADFKKIKEVLKEIGAKKEVVKRQKDHFFNLPTAKEDQAARLKLRTENGASTLIYYVRSNFQKEKATPAIVELLNVNGKDTLSFLQKALGERAVVEKRREVWRKDHTVFHLDDVKGVGKIFEVELQKNGKIIERDRALMREYQKKLTPFLGEVVKGSNVDLALK